MTRAEAEAKAREIVGLLPLSHISGWTLACRVVQHEDAFTKAIAAAILAAVEAEREACEAAARQTTSGPNGETVSGRKHIADAIAARRSPRPTSPGGEKEEAR